MVRISDINGPTRRMISDGFAISFPISDGSDLSGSHLMELRTILRVLFKYCTVFIESHQRFLHSHFTPYAHPDY